MIKRKYLVISNTNTTKHSILGILTILLLLFMVPITTADIVTIFPIEDTYIDSSHPNDNFVGSSYITADAAIYYNMPNDSTIILLKYDIPVLPNGVIIDSAKLKPYAMTISSTTPHIAVYNYSKNDWDPTTVTWNNFIMDDLVYLSEISVPYADKRYALDVKNAIKIGSTITLVMKSTRTDPGYESATFYSTNSYNISRKPIINITYSIPNGDILAYYRGLGQYPDIVETNDLLKAADDWRGDIIPPGFSVAIVTDQLLTLADEWRNS